MNEKAVLTNEEKEFDMIIKDSPEYKVRLLAAIASEIVDLYEYADTMDGVYSKMVSDDSESLQSELLKEKPDSGLVRMYTENIEKRKLRLEALDVIRRGLDRYERMCVIDALGDWMG